MRSPLSVTMHAVGSEHLSDPDVSQVHLACGRIAGVAQAIAEVHRFGQAEGPHERPWTAEYHREAMEIYGKSLPRSYQRNVGMVFGRCAEVMGELSIPGAMAEDWVIVTEYLREASLAIAHWLSTREPDPESESASSSDIEPRTPAFVHFDELAKLTTLEGVSRLERAALAVQSHLYALLPDHLSDLELRLLEMVASGTQVVDIAVELNYSPRSIYRKLVKLWGSLGGHNRTEGLHKAAEKGLID